MKTKVIISLLTVLALGTVGVWLSSREKSSKASEPIYPNLISKNVTEENKRFTDLACMGLADSPWFRDAFILQDTNHVSPKGVPYRDVLVAVKIVADEGTFYGLKAIDYRKGKCSVYYTSVEDGEESNPLNRTFSPQKSLKIQLIWDSWQLKNVPGWRNKMQKYLDKKRVQLAKEEYLSLKQLGFKMPKKWQEIH